MKVVPVTITNYVTALLTLSTALLFSTDWRWCGNLSWNLFSVNINARDGKAFHLAWPLLLAFPFRLKRSGFNLNVSLWMSSSSKNILWWCHVFAFIIVLMTPVLFMFYVLIVFDNKCKSNECLIFLNLDTNKLWGNSVLTDMIELVNDMTWCWALSRHKNKSGRCTFTTNINLGQTQHNFWGQCCLFIKSFLLKTWRMF